jgi:hypothetical protein
VAAALEQQDHHREGRVFEDRVHVARAFVPTQSSATVSPAAG